MYFDVAATAKPCEKAIKAANECFEGNYGNPSSLHSMGINAEKVIGEARKTIAAAVVCAPDDVTFTSGATESNNQALLCVAKRFGRKGNKIITSSVEHPSVEMTMRELEKIGFEVVRVKPNSKGFFNHEDFINAVDERTILISLMLVNNENGMILPVSRVFFGVKQKNSNVITHTDAVQAFTKIPVKATELKADLVTLSAHKIGGIKGVGALICRDPRILSPWVFGGGQEDGLRSGTENVPAIAAFGAAVKYSQKNAAKNDEKLESLYKYILAAINKRPYITLNSVCGGGSNFVKNIVNFSVDGIKSEIMLHYLESKGIFVSSGSACSKGKKSKVLEEFGVQTPDFALRVSFMPTAEIFEFKQLFNEIDYGYQNLIKINSR